MNRLSDDHPGEDLLNEYLDDLLDQEAKEQLEAHLADCPACAGELQDLQQVFLDLASLPDVQLEVDLSSSVLESVKSNREARRGIRWIFVFQSAVVLLMILLVGPSMVALSARISSGIDLSPQMNWLLQSLVLFQASIGSTLQSLESVLFNFLEVENLFGALSVQTTHIISLAGGVFLLWVIVNSLLLRESNRLNQSP